MEGDDDEEDNDDKDDDDDDEEGDDEILIAFLAAPAVSMSTYYIQYILAGGLYIPLDLIGHS